MAEDVLYSRENLIFLAGLLQYQDTFYLLNICIYIYIYRYSISIYIETTLHNEQPRGHREYMAAQHSENY